MPKVSYQRLGEYQKNVLTILFENGGELPAAEVLEKLRQRLDLSEYEKGNFDSGAERWKQIARFYSINLVKAGWLIKKKGIWYLTPEGEEVIHLSPIELYRLAETKYKEWVKAHPKPIDESTQDDAEEEDDKGLAYEAAVDTARQELSDYLMKLEPYPFQDFVAALLRAMGYYTPFVAPKGKDGGIDILAYRDPLGGQTPRIKVQVKHRQQKAGSPEIQQLLGALVKDGDTGLFVSSSGFSSDAMMAVRNAAKHVETLDLDELINLWVDHYDKLSEEDRTILPLRSVAFLAPAE